MSASQAAALGIRALLSRGPDASRAREGHARRTADWGPPTERKQDSILSSTRWPASSLHSGGVVERSSLAAPPLLSCRSVCSPFPILLIDSNSPADHSLIKNHIETSMLYGNALAFCLCAEDFDEPRAAHFRQKHKHASEEIPECIRDCGHNLGCVDVDEPWPLPRVPPFVSMA